MAFFDSLLQLSNAQAVTTTANSTTVYDVFGVGSGTVAPLVTGTTTPGVDIGAGDGVAEPIATFYVTTAFAGGTSMSIAVQAAPDNGSGSAGTYYTLTQSQVFLTAALIKGLQVTLRIPPVPSGTIPPRFYRFVYTVVGTMSAGNITGGILLNSPISAGSTQYANNYTVV